MVSVILCFVMLNFIMLSVIVLKFHYAECRYDECRYAVCHYAGCRYAECRGALFKVVFTFEMLKDERVIFCKKNFQGAYTIKLFTAVINSETQ